MSSCPENFTNEGTLTGSNVVDIPPEQPDEIPQFTAPDTGVSTDKAAASDFVKIEADKNAATEYKPIVEKTNSGIDIVQIASANSDGVSRNLYTWFDVNKSGLILNNATEYVNTQLGGYVDYNYRLGLRPAKIILNEVTSANPSSINGLLKLPVTEPVLLLPTPMESLWIMAALSIPAMPCLLQANR